MIRRLSISCFLFLSIFISAQKLVKVDEVHTVNIKSLQLNTPKHLYMIKFTFNAGLNSTLSYKPSFNTDIFYDIDNNQYLLPIKYDFRGKIYLTKRYRLLFRTITIFNKNVDYYTLGIMYKF